jgi:hypothetical protein
MEKWVLSLSSRPAAGIMNGLRYRRARRSCLHGYPNPLPRRVRSAFVPSFHSELCCRRFYSRRAIREFLPSAVGCGWRKARHP